MPTSSPPAGAAPVLRLHELAVGAGGRRLLAGISLDLRPGELVALLGPSGSGKTTLLRAIAGLEDPLEGRIELDGHGLDETQAPLYRRRAVLVSQRPVLFAGTVRENLRRAFGYKAAGTAVTSPAAGAGDGAAYREETAADLLRRLLVPVERLDQEGRSLSEGEQQRVCLARALLLVPPVLLLDEPTSALDEEAARAAETIVRAEARGRGLAALIVTHARGQAERWCDRVVEVAGRG